MRRLAFSALLICLAVAAGCGKKPAPGPAPEPGEPAPSQPGQPKPDAATAERTKLLNGLKSTKQESRRYSIEELSWLAEDDPAVVPALVELLKDKATAGSGRTRPDQINSTREAAALAIMQCFGGPKAMREKGLPVLREGLSDPKAEVREHTAYTIGVLGSIAKPLAADVQKLCTDPDDNVRGVAFDTLRVVGVADPVAMAKLLAHEKEDVVRLAAELIPLIQEMPEAAVAPLTEALKSENSNVQLAAATGLGAAGPKAAPAAPLLADAIRKAYPAEYDAKAAQFNGPERAYWKALARIGEASVAPTAKLLEHKNPLVRALAARTLGEIGMPAKSAKDALKKALGDDFIVVGVEAAVALCALGESQAEAVALVKRALDAPGDTVAGTAIEGIPRMGKAGAELVPLAFERMNHLNPYTRAAAVWLAGQVPPAEASKVAAEIGKRATDEQPDIRRLAGSVLEQLGPHGSAAAEALGQALPKEKEIDIREQFVEALIAMGAGAKPAAPALVPLVAEKPLGAGLRAKLAAAVVVADPASPQVSAALVKAAGDEDAIIRTAAARAMGHLDPLPTDALAKLVDLAKRDDRTKVRAAAIRALATAGPRAKAAKPDLEAITGSKMADLALWAKVALAALDGDVQKAAPVIRAGLTDRSGQARASAVEALLLIGPTQADLPALVKLLQEVNGATKLAAAQCVARLGPPAADAVPQLTRLLDDREYEVRLAAAAALGRIGPAAKPAAAKLKELRADPMVRTTAQRALDKIEGK